MRPAIEVLPRRAFATEAAAAIAALLPRSGAVVITGGGTAERVYPELTRVRPDWSGLDVFFSDERCVPPDDPASNYGMARRTLLQAVALRSVHRMEGELPPEEAARRYDEVLRPVGAFALGVLGIGEDAHVAGLFPRSPALLEPEALCLEVERPDGLRGLTLTPPALLRAARVVFVATGTAKAPAVARAIDDNEDVTKTPAALFRGHPDVTWLLDEAAAG